jgi:hypothetical protein
MKQASRKHVSASGWVVCISYLYALLMVTMTTSPSAFQSASLAFAFSLAWQLHKQT